MTAHACSPTCLRCRGSAGQRAYTERMASVDEMAVDRILTGGYNLATRAERQAAVEYLTERCGNSNTTAAQRLRISVRTVERLRTRARTEAGADV